MKITLSIEDIAQKLLQDKYAKWSRGGAIAIADYLDGNEHSCKEFCEVEIRSDWSEYDSAFSAAKDNGWEWDGEEKNSMSDDMDDSDIESREIDAMEFLRENTIVIEFGYGGAVIVQSF